MAKSRYAAYAGEATMPNGARVEVRYLDASAIRTLFGFRPPGHPQRRRVGWYWAYKGLGPHGRDVDLRGQFTSSRLAMQDAIEKNPAA